MLNLKPPESSQVLVMLLRNEQKDRVNDSDPLVT